MMPLPANCKAVRADQWTILSEAEKHRDISEAHFAIYDDEFLKIIGPSPTIKPVIEKDWPFAHEAGVYIPSQDAVYITSNGLDTPNNGKTIKIGVVTRSSDEQYRYEEIKTDIAMGNGGINYANDSVLFCDQGDLTHAGGLVVMNTQPPYATKTLVSSYHWRPFTSVNDVVLHTDGSIWFTDPIYGFEQGFREKPKLPAHVYRFDVKTGSIRAVADGFGRPNGLCFSPDEKTMYVTDTDWIHGDGTTDLGRASSIYAFDVIERASSQFLANRRLFAVADEGIPDGIKCDLQGNVYSGCGDGVNVWSAGAVLLGKIKIPGGAANFCFGRKGEMFILNETRFYVAKLSQDVQGALLANMKIEV